MTAGFRQGLRDLGYVEGRSVVIEFRDAEGKLKRLPALAAELVSLKVDVIVVGGTVAAVAAKQATKTVPIVFVSAIDPVAGENCSGHCQPRWFPATRHRHERDMASATTRHLAP